ncbi:hypothetical protein M409DRAFT_58696 [Zasmidium cellare ATCC 36951]|uniref:Uncharacterized protein n=1 Tax=Zasmidium cellare ATCC 36951 TaxID=1080233 RepID=A0A6A6C8D7_ZASCE|nr:uncharacterized protein M409DRAFT_58696 [Zasmidium cellare ATCC 36951]KAF2161919.1 hypothetical protein M409DRAFT_58696 [Zasmidium cellare ATCC 36951]
MSPQEFSEAFTLSYVVHGRLTATPRCANIRVVTSDEMGCNDYSLGPEFTGSTPPGKPSLRIPSVIWRPHPAGWRIPHPLSRRLAISQRCRKCELFSPIAWRGVSSKEDDKP